MTLSIGGWDTHGQNFTALKKQLPQVDRGVANLIQDLHDRGMDNDVVTVMWGEFGRTPKINSNAGRDHWSPVMSALIAGGGLKMGQAVGASTARGERPKDGRYHGAAGAQHASTGPSASTRRRRSPTAAAGRCTSSTTASRSRSCCNCPSESQPLERRLTGSAASLRSRERTFRPADRLPPADSGSSRSHDT